jgi:hypothetical protein
MAPVTAAMAAKPKTAAKIAVANQSISASNKRPDHQREQRGEKY